MTATEYTQNDYWRTTLRRCLGKAVELDTRTGQRKGTLHELTDEDAVLLAESDRMSVPLRTINAARW